MKDTLTGLIVGIVAIAVIGAALLHDDSRHMNRNPSIISE